MGGDKDRFQLKIDILELDNGQKKVISKNKKRPMVSSGCRQRNLSTALFFVLNFW
ncbi:hypothetical protein [uncultured Ilyobacter sp.]|uniref:hypothetical protein n=1 Tax=uncultured Ilyobacter sp. TaxID=544433 RepID=UPI0037494192